MNDTDFQDLVGTVKIASDGCRGAFESEAAIDVVLERLWTLQDWLGRLVDAASDRPVEASHMMQSMQPGLIGEIQEVLNDSRVSFSNRVPGVSRSRTAIRSLLNELGQGEHELTLAAAGGR